jgi:hypothetical protein
MVAYLLRQRRAPDVGQEGGRLGRREEQVGRAPSGRPAPRPQLGKRRAVDCIGDLAYLEASLFDAVQALIASATATARVIPLRQAPGAA